MHSHKHSEAKGCKSKKVTEHQKGLEELLKHSVNALLSVKHDMGPNDKHRRDWVLYKCYISEMFAKEKVQMLYLLICELSSSFACSDKP